MAARAETFAQLIQDKAPGCQILAQVGAFELITSWTAAGGSYPNTWKATIVQRLSIHNYRTINRVTFADPALATPVAVALDEMGSVDEVEASSGSFFFDSTTSVLYVHLASDADPNDQVAYAGFTLYFSTGDPHNPGRTFIEEVSGAVYYPYICEAPQIDKAIEDPFYGGATTGTASLGLDAASGNLDQIWRLYVWDYGTVTILFGGANLPLAEYDTIFVGSTSGKSWSDGVARLDLVDGLDPLLATVSGAPFTTDDTTNSYLYTGSGSYGYGYQGATSNYASFTTAAGGSFGGGNTLEVVIELGQPKPLVFGSLKGFEPAIVSIESTHASKHTAIVCLSDVAYKSISQIYVGGSTVGVSWWINEDSGFVAIMLSVGVAGAASSINAGITVDFEATELEPGTLMTNPADIVSTLCSSTRQTAAPGISAWNPIVTSTDISTQWTFTGAYGTSAHAVAILSSLTAGQDSSGLFNGVTGTDFTPVRASTYIGTSKRNPAAGTYTGTGVWKTGALGGTPWAFNEPAVLHSNGYYYHACVYQICREYSTVTDLWHLATAGAGAYTNQHIAWQVAPESGLLFVVKTGTAPGVVPYNSINLAVECTVVDPDAGGVPVGESVPTGPLVALNGSVLSASRTLCTNYNLALSVKTATPLRDILIQIARDTLSSLYVDNGGLICFDTYTPTTTGELEMTEDSGDFLSSPTVEEVADQNYRSVNVEYSFDTNRENRNGGNYLTASVTIAESIGLLSGKRTDFQVDASFHATEASALKLANRLAKMTSRGSPVYKIDAPIKCMSWDLGQKVSIDRSRLPVATLGGTAHCMVTKVSRDLNSVTVTLELRENLISDLAGSW